MFNDEDEAIAARLLRQSSQSSHSSHRRRAATMHALIQEADDKLMEELREQNADLRARLERLQATLRAALIQNEGLVDTVRHLKAHWNPSDPAEATYKDKIDPLIDKKTREVEADADVVARIDQAVQRVSQSQRKR